MLFDGVCLSFAHAGYRLVTKQATTDLSCAPETKNSQAVTGRSVSKVAL